MSSSARQSASDQYRSDLISTDVDGGVDPADLGQVLTLFPQPLNESVPKPPQVTEVTVHYHGGGKVALEEYGKESYEYGASVSRKYAIPPHWTESQVRDFEVERILDIRENIDPLLQEDRDELIKARRF